MFALLNEGLETRKPKMTIHLQKIRAGELELSDVCSNPEGPIRTLPNSLAPYPSIGYVRTDHQFPYRDTECMQPGTSHQVKGSFPSYMPGSRHLWVGYLVSSHSVLRANHQSRRFKTGILGISLNSLLLSNAQAFKWPCLHHFLPKSEEKLDTQHSAPFPLICPYLLFAAQKS